MKARCENQRPPWLHKMKLLSPTATRQRKLRNKTMKIKRPAEAGQALDGIETYGR